MQVGQQEKQGDHVISKKRVFEPNILLEENIKVNEPQVSQPGKQRHNGFIGKSHKPDERIAHKFNEGSTRTIKVKPGLAPKVP